MVTPDVLTLNYPIEIGFVYFVTLIIGTFFFMLDDLVFLFMIPQRMEEHAENDYGFNYGIVIGRIIRVVLGVYLSGIKWYENWFELAQNYIINMLTNE